MKEPIEYAIKKDVRNNPIVREIDESRQRALWRWVRIGAFLVTVGLFSAWQHFEIIRHGYSIDQMEREHSELEETARRLRLEIETLRSPQRIEALVKVRMRVKFKAIKDIDVPGRSRDCLALKRRQDVAVGGMGPQGRQDVSWHDPTVRHLRQARQAPRDRGPRQPRRRSRRRGSGASSCPSRPRP